MVRNEKKRTEKARVKLGRSEGSRHIDVPIISKPDNGKPEIISKPGGIHNRK